MRALIVISLLAMAGCGEDCPTSTPAPSSCSTEGMYCSSVDGYACTCTQGQWECVTSDDARFVVHDLSTRDLAPPGD